MYFRLLEIKISPTKSNKAPVRKEEDQPKPDAETILNALKANEKNLMKRQLDRGMKSKKLEKDW